jgi:hypothetical protein
MDAIGPDDLHILFDLVLCHDFLLCSTSYIETASAYTEMVSVKRLGGQKARLGPVLRATASHTFRTLPTPCSAAFASGASFARTSLDWIVI